MHPELERVLGAVPDGDLADVTLNDIRDRRATAQLLEESVSYLRRIIQVRLDILGTELAHRRSGDAPADMSELVYRLPEILAEHSRGPGFGQAPRDLRVPDLDAALAGTVDEIVPTSQLAELDQLSDEDLTALVDQLDILETDVSAARRALHTRLDALQAEITRRYRTGEASVDSLLQ